MPQTPSSSLLCKLWVDHLQKHALIISGQPPSWPVAVCTLQGHTGPVTSVTHSPDGRHIVSGSSDKTIRVWNAITGESVAGPFLGHEDWVWSVAYSPDGRHIVSGSSDKTIRVWNAITGESVAGPFQGHTGFIRSVAFSPDGRHIVSGSSDKTIRIWKTDSPLFFGCDLYCKDGWIQSSDSSCFGWITPWSSSSLCFPCHSYLTGSTSLMLTFLCVEGHGFLVGNDLSYSFVTYATCHVSKFLLYCCLCRISTILGNTVFALL